ncbi:ATP-dependent DNA helicase Q-like 4A [Linum grandiflorum]
MAAEEKFTWRIGNFSTFIEPEIFSNTFSIKGHQWKLSLRPKGIMGFMSAYLHFDDSQPTDNLFNLVADFRLTIVNRFNRRISLETTFREVCIMGVRAYKASAIWNAKLDLAPRGFLVDDTLVFEARIRKGVKATLYSDLLTLRTVLNQESDGKTSGCSITDATLQAISDRIPKTKVQLQQINGIGRKTIAKYGDRLMLTIESAISNYYEEEGSGSKCNNTNDSAKMKREFAEIEPFKAINSLAKPLPTKNKVARMSTTSSPSKAIKSLTEPLSTKNKVARMSTTTSPSKAINSLTEPLSTKNKQVARTSTTTSPCSSNVRTASKNLIAKLSTMPSCQKTTPVDDVQVSTNDGSALLLEQKGKLSEFFEMSLEAIWQANSFDSVRELVRKFSEIASDPFEKRMLKDLLSRLVEFNCSTPKSLSVIESSAAIETSNIQAKKQIEASLLERQNQLKVLDSEVSRIEEDQLKLDAEYKQLLSRRCKLGHEKNLAIAEMEAANREASRELVELEKKQAEHERARDDLRRAKEKLAQNNASWKFFKENLAL